MRVASASDRVAEWKAAWSDAASAAATDERKRRMAGECRWCRCRKGAGEDDEGDGDGDEEEAAMLLWSDKRAAHGLRIGVGDGRNGAAGGGWSRAGNNAVGDKDDEDNGDEDDGGRDEAEEGEGE